MNRKAAGNAITVPVEKRVEGVCEGLQTGDTTITAGGRRASYSMVSKCSWTHDSLSRYKKGIVTPWDRQYSSKKKVIDPSEESGS